MFKLNSIYSSYYNFDIINNITLCIKLNSIKDNILLMESMADIEKRLIETDKEIHSILRIVQKRDTRDSREIIESACGAWDYNVDCENFVNQLRKSSRLNWIE